MNPILKLSTGEFHDRFGAYLDDSEVFDAIRRNDVERLLMIPIELGFHHENWKFIQDISVTLSGHEDPRVSNKSSSKNRNLARHCLTL